LRRRRSLNSLSNREGLLNWMFPSDFSGAAGNSAVIQEGLERFGNDLQSANFVDRLDWQNSIASEGQTDGESYR
jgi:hypothetical protein